MAATEPKLPPQAEQALQELTDHIGNNPHKWVKFLHSYGETPVTTHEGAVAQAIALADKHPDFEQRFIKEVAGLHEKHFIMLLFTAIKAGLKLLGGAVKAISHAIQKAVQKHQEKKAAAAKAAEQQKQLAALQAAKKQKEDKRGRQIKIAGAVALLVITAGIIYWATRAKAKA